MYSAFCLMVEDGLVPAWMLIVILAREFAIAGMRTVAASDGIVILCRYERKKLKLSLQMIAVPLLLDNRNYRYRSASLPKYRDTDFSVGVPCDDRILGIEYIAKNKKVFAQ